MSVDISEILNWIDAGGSVVSAGGINKAIVEAGVGNDTDSEGGTISDMMTGTCVEKYGTYSKNVTLADTKYFMVEGYRSVFFFDSRILNEDTLYRSSLSSPGDKS